MQAGSNKFITGFAEIKALLSPDLLNVDYHSGLH